MKSKEKFLNDLKQLDPDPLIVGDLAADVYLFTPDEYKLDVDFTIRFVEVSWEVLAFVPDRTFFNVRFKEALYSKFIHEVGALPKREPFEDYEFMEKVLGLSIAYTKFLDPYFYEGLSNLKGLIEVNPDVYRFLPNKLREREDLTRVMVLSDFFDKNYGSIPDFIKRDEDFWISIVLVKPSVVSCLPSFYKELEFIDRCVYMNKDSLLFLDFEVLLHSEVLETVLNKYGNTMLSYIFEKEEELVTYCRYFVWFFSGDLSSFSKSTYETVFSVDPSCLELIEKRPL